LNRLRRRAEVKTIGDGFMASFTSVSSALDCAITLQRAFTTPVIASGVPEAIAIRVGSTPASRSRRRAISSARL
jgi:class 3 adenylate cyclase